MVETTHSRPLTLHIHYPPRPAATDPHHAGVILLKPARRSGARLVLCPLLPPSTKGKIQLPSESWARCLAYAMDLSLEWGRVNPKEFARLQKCRRDLLLVSKSFKVSLACLRVIHCPQVSFRTLLHRFYIRTLKYGRSNRWICSTTFSYLRTRSGTRFDGYHFRLRDAGSTSSIFRPSQTTLARAPPSYKPTACSPISSALFHSCPL